MICNKNIGTWILAVFILVIFVSPSYAEKIDANRSEKLHAIFNEIKNLNDLTDAQKQHYQNQLLELLPAKNQSLEDFKQTYPYSDFYKQFIQAQIRKALASDVSGLRVSKVMPEYVSFFYTDDSCQETVTGRLDLDKARAKASQLSEVVFKSLPEINKLKIFAACDITNTATATGKRDWKDFDFKRHI